jgi:hypothetical protein
VDAMNELRRSFDWLAFFVRVIAIVAVTTWLLTEHKHDRTGVVLVGSIGYVILPFITYFYTRYYNLRFMAGIVEAVRRRFGGSVSKNN